LIRLLCKERLFYRAGAAPDELDGKFEHRSTGPTTLPAATQTVVERCWQADKASAGNSPVRRTTAT